MMRILFLLFLLTGCARSTHSSVEEQQPPLWIGGSKVTEADLEACVGHEVVVEGKINRDIKTAHNFELTSNWIHLAQGINIDRHPESEFRLRGVLRGWTERYRPPTGMFDIQRTYTSDLKEGETRRNFYFDGYEIVAARTEVSWHAVGEVVPCSSAVKR